MVRGEVGFGEGGKVGFGEGSGWFWRGVWLGLVRMRLDLVRGVVEFGKGRGWVW